MFKLISLLKEQEKDKQHNVNGLKKQLKELTEAVNKELEVRECYRVLQLHGML